MSSVVMTSLSAIPLKQYAPKTQQKQPSQDYQREAQVLSLLLLINSVNFGE